MVTLAYEPSFASVIKKLRDKKLKEKIKKQIMKIIQNPEVGKPMRYARKDTREVRIPPFRLSYKYIKNENKLVLLSIYHKDRQ